MKEVKAKRYAGPYKFEEIPFENFIQSPIGLVPKDGGKDTRLIFHLSYPRSGSSVNSETPKELCSVKYPDFAEAIRLCVKEGLLRPAVIAKSDMKSAFHHLGLKPCDFPLLLMKCESPFDGVVYYFVEKALPFGSSISCSHFQRFSNSIAHITKVKNHGKFPINYMDDFFFISMMKTLCDQQVQKFLDICTEIKFLVSMEKTYWGTHVLTFLGLLIDTIGGFISIPADKLVRALSLIEAILTRKNGKTTVKELQRLCGFLNFICRCIVPGRAFTRRLYSKFSSAMKPHHHISINKEMREDLKVWEIFLHEPTAYCRPFIDFSKILCAEELNLFTDASGVIRCRGIFGSLWFQARSNDKFLRLSPSIEYQELFAVAAAVLLWSDSWKNRRICLFCDNTSVCSMLNTMSSSCKNCMVLIRKIVLLSLKNNVRIFAKHVSTKKNFYADALSRFQNSRFIKLGEKHRKLFSNFPEPMPEQIWPPEKIWIQ